MNIRCQVSSVKSKHLFMLSLPLKRNFTLDLYTLHFSKSRSSFITCSFAMTFQGCNFSLHRQHSLAAACELHYPFEALTHILCHTSSTQYFLYVQALLLQLNSSSEEYYHHDFSIFLSFTPSTALCTEQVPQYLLKI